MFVSEQAAREGARRNGNSYFQNMPCNTGSAISSGDLNEYAYTTRRMALARSYSSTGMHYAMTVIAIRSGESVSFGDIENPLYGALSLDNILSPADAISYVRDVFGLNVSQAARVFQVERPTIYLWSNSKDMSTVRQQNRERIKQLFSIAKKWLSWGKLPVGSNEALLFQGTETLLDLLSASPIEVNKMHEAHDQLKQLVAQLKLHEYEKAKAALRGLKAGFKRMNDQLESRKKGL